MKLAEASFEPGQRLTLSHLLILGLVEQKAAATGARKGDTVAEAKLRVAINGFGRIGKILLTLCLHARHLH